MPLGRVVNATSGRHLQFTNHRQPAQQVEPSGVFGLVQRGVARQVHPGRPGDDGIQAHMLAADLLPPGRLLICRQAEMIPAAIGQ